MKKSLSTTFVKVARKAKPYLLTLSLFLFGLLNQVVYADDPFQKTNTLAQQGITRIQGIGIVVFGLAVVATGLVYGLAGRELKAKIKQHWVQIAIAIVAVSAGPSIIEWAWKFVAG